MARGNTYNMAFALNAKMSSSFNKSFNQAAKQINSLANTAKVAMGTLLGAVGISSTVGTAFGEAMNLEGYRMQLETATKSAEKAGEIMKWSVDLANKTPFETGSVVEASARLEAMGMSAQKFLPMIGDMAGATNKDLIQATEAIIDAQTGELERLKEFGLKKADIVQYAYDKMGKIQVVNNKGQITDQDKFNEAMLALMDEKFKGGMEKQASTMKGLMSTVSGVIKSGMATAVGMTADGTIKQGSLFDMLKGKVKQVADTLVKWQQNGAFEKIGTSMSNGISNTISALKSMRDWGVTTYNLIKSKILENRPLLDECSQLIDSIKNAFINLKDGASTLDWLKDTAMPLFADGIMFALEKAIALCNFVVNNWSAMKPIIIGIGVALATWKVTTLVVGYYKMTKAIIATTIAQYRLIKAKVIDMGQTLYLKALYAGSFLKSLLLQGKAVAANALAWTINTAQMVAQKAGLLALKGVQLISTGVTTAMTVAQWALNAAFIASPIGWIVLGIAALIAIGVLLWKNWDTIKAKAIELWESFKVNFGGLVSFFSSVWETIKLIFASSIENLKTIIGGIMQAFNGVITFFQGVFTGNWQMVWDGLKNIVAGVFQSLVGVVTAPINTIISLVNGMIGAINKISIDIPDWVPVVGGQTFGVNIPQIPMFAKGTNNTPDTFIAGEEGPELITNAKGRKVFTASRTKSMLSSRKAFGDNGKTIGKPSSSISLQFNPQIYMQSGNSSIKEEVAQALAEAKREWIKEVKALLKGKGRLAFE